MGTGRQPSACFYLATLGGYSLEGGYSQAGGHLQDRVALATLGTAPTHRPTHRTLCTALRIASYAPSLCTVPTYRPIGIVMSNLVD